MINIRTFSVTYLLFVIFLSQIEGADTGHLTIQFRSMKEAY